jgi:diguanylate cyclase (GGDEF)-like protein/PAS domain S-box-containing protein
MTEKRRKHQRYAIRTKAEFIAESNPKRIPIVTTVKNVSRGGVCVYSYNPVEKGARLTLIRLDECGVQVNVKGIVAWVSRNGGSFIAGICFQQKLNLQELQTIYECLFHNYAIDIKKDYEQNHGDHVRDGEGVPNGEEKCRCLLESIDDSIYMVDRNYTYVFTSRKFRERTGLSDEQCLGHPYSDFHSLKETKEFTDIVDRVFEKGESIEREHRSSRDDRYFLRTVNPVKGSDGQTIAVSVVSKDITDIKKREEELLTLALTDDLTDLYNRRGFFILAKQELKIANRMKRGILVLSVDVDNLKGINDGCGHREGDTALKDTADILRECFRESDIIARLGGDEFLVFMIESTPSDIEILAKRLNMCLEEQNTKRERRYTLSLSMGVAFFEPKSSYSLDEMLVQADSKMYEQKRLKQLS